MLHECQLALLRQGVADMSGLSLRTPLLLNQRAASQLGAQDLSAEPKVPTLFSTMWGAGARGWMGGHPACSETAVATRPEELPGCPSPMEQPPGAGVRMLWALGSARNGIKKIIQSRVSGVNLPRRKLQSKARRVLICPPHVSPWCLRLALIIDISF